MAGAGPGRRSRPFAVTCALLRQYMREEGQRQVRMGNLARVLQAPPPTPVAPQESDERTMQLFPVPVHAAAAIAQPPAYLERSEMGKAPMTIFYGGQVMFFDHIPAEKANEVMHVAGSSVNAPPAEKVVVDVPDATDEASAGVDQQTIARKASLQRFLQKRKRRAGGNNDPDDDQNEDPEPAKRIDAGGSGERLEDVPDALWLRL